MHHHCLSWFSQFDNVSLFHDSKITVFELSAAIVVVAAVVVVAFLLVVAAAVVVLK